MVKQNKKEGKDGQQDSVTRKQVKSIMQAVPNAWTIFLNETRVRVPAKSDVEEGEIATKDTTTINGKAEVKRLSEVWKAMSTEDKAPFKNKSTLRRQENKLRLAGLSLNDKSTLRLFKKQNPRVKRVASPYMNYVRSVGSAVIKKLGIKLGGAELGQTWKKMSVEERSAFRTVVGDGVITMKVESSFTTADSPVSISQTD